MNPTIPHKECRSLRLRPFIVGYLLRCFPDVCFTTNKEGLLMANEPRGPQGPREPNSPAYVAGISGRRFSDKQLEIAQEIAERDQWDDAHDAFSPINRPVILQQLNPLAIPKKNREWPEVWMVYVPHTPIAWSDYQMVRDWRRRTAPKPASALNSTNDAAANQNKRAPQPRQQLRDNLKARQTILFNNADEAAAFAQDTWRQYWQNAVPEKLSQARQRFTQDATIEVTRVREFTYFLDNPAHRAQYEDFKAQYADGVFPPDIQIRGNTAEYVHQDPEQRARLIEQQQQTIKREGFRTQMALATDWFDLEENLRSADDELVAKKVDADDPWVLRHLGDAQWALVRPVPDSAGVEFWRNGTGRIAVLSGEEPAKIVETLPKNVPAVVHGDPTLPQGEPLRDMLKLARDHRYDMVSAREVQEWLAAEQAVGQTLKMAIAEDPAHAARWKGMVTQVVDIHTTVLPPDGVLAGDPSHLERHYQQLLNTVDHLPRNDTQQRLAGQVRHWHRTSGELSQDSLGIFRYQRLPDAAFKDTNVEHGKRVDSLGNWLMTKTASGEFIVASMGQDGVIDRIDLPTYRNEDAARIRIANAGGVPDLKGYDEHDSIVDLWYKQAEYALGPEEATRRLNRLKTPSAALRKIEYAAQQAQEPKLDAPQKVAMANLGRIGHFFQEAAERSFGQAEAERKWQNLTERHPMLQTAADLVSPHKSGAKPLYVAPWGHDCAVVWQEPENAKRLDQSPELVRWHGDRLVAMNKHARGGWLPPLGPNDSPRVFEDIPESQRPWVVHVPGGLKAQVAEVQARVPEAVVSARVLPDASVARALVERYGLPPKPLKGLEDTLWTLHPTPRQSVMMSTKEWIATPKPDWPNEWEMYQAVIPYRQERDGTQHIFEWPSAAQAKRDLDKNGFLSHVSDTMPPEVFDWFDRKLAQHTLDNPAIRWGSVEPWKALQHASRFVRESFVADRRERQFEEGRPLPERLMEHQLMAGALGGRDTVLTAQDFANALPDASHASGKTWDEVEQQVRDYAREWLSERPKLAEKLTRPQPAPRVASRAPAISI